MRRLALGGIVLALIGPTAARADDPVFSGPQVGETLAPFQVRGVYDEDAGREFDPISRADGKPVFLVFVHEATRPSIALTRALMTYAARHAGDGLAAGVVWLDDDATAAEQFLRRARHAMPTGVPIGISVDGAEGPGAYGLNRNVTLTVLVGKEGMVTANFALVQPSVQADAPKILAEVAELIGGEVPSLEELMPSDQARGAMRPSRPDETDPKLAELLRAVIRTDAGPEQVDRAAKAVEAYVAEDPKARTQVGQIARRIIDSGRLDSYGTPEARAYLRAWAKRFGPTGEGEDRPETRDEPGAKPDAKPDGPDRPGRKDP